VGEENGTFAPFEGKRVRKDREALDGLHLGQVGVDGLDVGLNQRAHSRIRRELGRRHILRVRTRSVCAVCVV